ncbi:MAG: DNA translocase FtsK 4TM domain-containing protein [Lishizhenia sp.]
MAKGNTLKSNTKTSSKKKTTSSKKASKKNFSLKDLKLNVDKRKAKTISGAVLLLLSLFLLFACISYLFTWKEDQNLVLHKGLFTFLFEDEVVPVSNMLGRFGAWISHLFIFKWFGVASFGFCFLFFNYGFRLLFNIKIASIRRSTLITFVAIVWISIFFGFFASQINYLGGAFGFYANEWLFQSIGAVGTFLFILALLFVAVVALFNPDFKALLQKLNLTKEKLNEEDEENTSVAANDIRIVNTIKDEEIKPEEEVNEITFSEEEEEEKEPESTLIIDVPQEKESSEEEVLEEDSAFEVENTTEDNDEFEVEVPKEDEKLTDNEVRDLAEEFGEYDPKLDLASYTLPGIDLLKQYGSGKIEVDKAELESNKNKIVETLSHYKIEIAKIKATIGPTVTLYEIVPAPGVRISKIKNLEDDIALSLAALGIRIIAPIPGKGTIGIEVPNSKPDMVSMRSLIASEKFQNSDAELPIVMGKTITNETFTFDLAKMPHLLVAGATGQGKSVGLNAILVSLLYKKHPAQVKFVLVDPKKVELTLFNKIERHFLAKLPDAEEPIITDTSKVVATLNSLCVEMDARYELLKNAQVRNIKEYNAKFIKRKLNPENGHRYLPYIVVLIDEFADLIMTAGKEVEHPIARIAQLARAIGIHLIVATQRPSVNVITGMIKANFPARIAFRVQSSIDSKTILDGSGANQLIGRGDMLMSTGSETIRLQCGFVDTPEVEDICNFIGNQRAYPDALILPEYVDENAEQGGDVDMDDLDSNFVEAARIIVIHQQGSASLLQRKLKLGYNRAGRIVDQLEAHNIIGPFKGSKAREVLVPDEIALNEYLTAKGLI